MAKKKSAPQNDLKSQIKALETLLNAHNVEPKTIRMTFNQQAEAVKKTVEFCQDWMNANGTMHGAATVNDDDIYQKYKKKSERAYKKFRDAAETIAEIKVTKGSPNDFKILSKAVDNLHGDYSKDALWKQLKPAVMALK